MDLQQVLVSRLFEITPSKAVSLDPSKDIVPRSCLKSRPQTVYVCAVRSHDRLLIRVQPSVAVIGDICDWQLDATSLWLPTASEDCEVTDCEIKDYPCKVAPVLRAGLIADASDECFECTRASVSEGFALTCLKQVSEAFDLCSMSLNNLVIARRSRSVVTTRKEQDFGGLVPTAIPNREPPTLRLK